MSFLVMYVSHVFTYQNDVWGYFFKKLQICYSRKFFEPSSLKHNGIYLPKQPDNKGDWTGFT